MMEFNNLDCNIMDILGDHWKRSDTSGPFELSCILDAFSDIPKENLMGALLALQKAGSLYLHKGGQTLSLRPAVSPKSNHCAPAWSRPAFPTTIFFWDAVFDPMCQPYGYLAE
jgi:hypothetical protein